MSIEQLFSLSLEQVWSSSLKLILNYGYFSVMAAWLYNKLWVNRKFYPSSQSMQGKTVIITGGNTGIGYETAKDLLQRGSI